MNRSWRLAKAEGVMGGGGRVDPVEAAKAEALRLVNAWHHAFHLDGGDRGVAMEHDHHCRAIGAADDVMFDNQIWRAALSVASGWTFEVVDGMPKPVQFDVEAFERNGGAQALLRRCVAEAQAWKIAAGHNDRCQSCAVDAIRKRRGVA